MYTDPIADLLTRIRNGITAHHESAIVPHSKIKENILKVMKEKGFIEDYKIEEHKGIKNIKIIFAEKHYDMTLKRVSSPGQRIYIKKENIKPIKNGLGISIISTSKGIMSNVEAKRNQLGGELLCEIY